MILDSEWIFIYLYLTLLLQGKTCLNFRFREWFLVKAGSNWYFEG